MAQPALTGPIHVPEADIDDLKRKNSKLQRELDDLGLELQKSKTEVKRLTQVLTALRDSPLNPIFRVLKVIYGELDSVDLPPSVATSSGNISIASTSNTNPKFEAALQRLTGKNAEVLKLIMEMGPMSVPAMATTLNAGKQRIYDATSYLGRAGLLKKGEGGKFHLCE
jgi:hypothetical protein